MDLSFLRRLSVGSELSEQDFRHLEQFVSNRDYTAGSTLAMEGMGGHELILIRQGTVSVTKRDKGGREQPLVKLVGPTVLGEIELLIRQPFAATVTAETAVQGVALPWSIFDRQLSLGDPTIAKLLRNLARVIAERLVQANARYVGVAH